MYTLDKIRPVWAEINLDNLAHNIKEVVRITSDKTMITAVVKADGYGHGAVMVSKTFLENGADRLAVATLSEGIELRKANIKDPILILGYTPENQFDEVVKYDLIQTIYNYKQGQVISEVSKNQNVVTKIHIKIDTGMSRLGFLPSDESVEDMIKVSKLCNVEIEGIYTHFAASDEKDKTFTRNQFKKFNEFIVKLESYNIYIPIKHVSNSAAIIDINDYNLDMVRAGIMLYGLYPSEDVKIKNVNLKPAMALKAKISHIKELPENTGISYGHIYHTNKSSKIGTLPLGYADGLSRLLSNKTEATINNIRVPLIGRICMDQCMVDLSNIPDARIDDEAILFSDGNNNTLHIDEIGKSLGTINYEVVCMISKRVPRVYIKNNEIIYIKEYI